MASSMKRELPLINEHEAKKPKFAESEPSVPPKMNHRVVLNPADCDLDFNNEGSGVQGSALYEDGFAYCWSGARANVGITRGKYCFSCKVISAQPVKMDDTSFDEQHLCRVGISRGDDKVGNLGESEHSFGFGGTGKFSNAGKYSTYGERYDVGDTILCAVNLDSKPMASIGFAKNGKWLGAARHLDAGPIGLGVADSRIRGLHWESAVFPHVLLKNVVVKLQFSCEDGLVPEQGYKPWASALEDGNALMGPTFLNLCDCEVIMMVGLPASGKTTWAEKWVNDHPEKRYVLLGTNLALDQMKVPGLLRKNNYGERFDLLMDRATAIFNTLMSRASRTPRNFIIDQTNVFKSARKRKLKPFANYQKIAVVSCPNPEVLKARADKRFKEMGKAVPAEAVNEMLANFVLPKSKDMPGTDEYFDQVVFIELNNAESQRCLDEMKASLKSSSGFSPYSRESSIQSYNSTSMQYSHESSIQSYTAQCSHGSSTQYGLESSIQSYKSTPVQYSLHPQNNPALQTLGASSGGHWQSSYPSQLMSTADPSAGSFFPRDDFNHRRTYSGYNQSGGSVIESAPLGVSDPYQSNSAYGLSGNYYQPDSRSMNLLPGGATNYQSGLVESYAFPYSTYGGHPSVPGGLQVDMQAPRQALPRPATSTPYGPPPPTSTPYGPPPPTSTPYGAPYGIPNLRPSYGNHPPRAPPSGGHAPYHQGYY